MSEVSKYFTLPVGRMVLGDLYNPETTDADGNPLTVKNGPNAGQARTNYFFAVAIPKGAEANWWETPWGAQMLQIAQQDWPRGEWKRPDFAWKIKDGNQPNKKGNVVKEAKDCWLISLGSGMPPTIWNANGSQRLLEPGVVKRGHYVEVQCSYTTNNSTQTPGMYLNHSNVAHAAFGPEISSGPDVSTAGFGKGPLPPGASAVPAGGLGGGVPGGAVPGAMPGAIPGAMPGAIPGAMPGAIPGAMPGATPGAVPGAIPGAMPGAIPGAMPGAIPGAGALVPNPAFLAPPPAAPVKYIVQGVAYDEAVLKQHGYTDAQLATLQKA